VPPTNIQSLLSIDISNIRDPDFSLLTLNLLLLLASITSSVAATNACVKLKTAHGNLTYYSGIDSYTRMRLELVKISVPQPHHEH
jgi:hypothetical protein